MDPPFKPSETDCCNSGCNPCILDVYDSQLRKYKEWLKQGGTPDKPSTNVMNPTKFTQFQLVSRTKVTPSVYQLQFVFKGSPLESERSTLKYNPGQHFLMRNKDNEGEFSRAYTPLPVCGIGELEFVIIVRIYEIGRMSRILRRCKVGDIYDFRGPYGDFDMETCYTYKDICMIAQGTGIAPLYSIISALVKDENLEAFVKLFYCCRNCDEILLRQQLYELKSYWNFTYDIFLSDVCDYNTKYEEIINKFKLNKNVIADYKANKKNLQVIICGNAQFSLAIGEHFTDNVFVL